MVHLVGLSTLVLAVFLVIVESQTTKDNTASNETKLEEDVSNGGSQKWGYVNVRTDAHMFYWLYNTTHPDGPKERPWIIWLQGGPGGSSCGYGNLNEIGPLTPDLEPRNTTWVKQASILFVDSPVGAGFSYVDNETAYNTNDTEIIDDLMEFLRVFLERTPFLKTRPLYIFGQSYGGKVAAHLSKRLYDAIQLKSIEANLTGFAMGDAWISPLDAVLKYADFAFMMSVVDENGRDKIQEMADYVAGEIEKGNWTQATEFFWWTQGQLFTWSNKVSVYDISKFMPGKREQENVLLRNRMEYLKTSVLNGIVPQHINWSASFNTVAAKFDEHLMKPSISVVDDLLKTTDLQVIIYQGQLDIICNYEGALQWVQNLTWSDLASYNETVRIPLINPVDNQTEGFVKAYGKFKFYSILGAGIDVPRDKGEAAYRMLDRILNNVDRSTNNSYDLSIEE